jgi:hypothetical protein
MMRKSGHGNGRYFHGKGDFYILIVTSGRLLKWPYSRFSDPPQYQNRGQAIKVIKDYINFCNICDDTKYKRVEAEFEVIEVKDYKQN